MEGEKLRILMINNTKQENPSYTMRNKIVAQALEKRGHTVMYKSLAFNLDYEDYDVFIFNRFYEGTLAQYVEFLKEQGKVVIYETDDNYEAIDENNPYMKIKDFGVLSSRELIKLAHGVTVSTPELKAEILRMFPGTKVFVIPNALNFEEYPVRKAGNEKLKVGFQGSNIHVQDLLLLLPAIKQLQSETPFDFEIFGIDDKGLDKLNTFCLEYKNQPWKWMKDFPKMYAQLQDGIEYTHIPYVHYEQYRTKLAELNWDIGLAPLTDTRFNRSKSCLKFYEYAAVGTVTLASDVIPYNEEMEPEDLVKNRHSKWMVKLRRLLNDDAYRLERLKVQTQWVTENRNIDKVAEQWERTINFIKEDL